MLLVFRVASLSSLLLRVGVDLCSRFLRWSDVDPLHMLLLEFGVDLLSNVLLGFEVGFPRDLPLGIGVA